MFASPGGRGGTGSPVASGSAGYSRLSPYGMEPFWEQTYRGSPGMATILGALAEHDAMISGRVGALREAAARAQVAKNAERGIGADGVPYGAPLPPLEAAGSFGEQKGQGFMDWLKTKYLGQDQQFQMGDLAKIGRGALGLLSNPVAFGLSTAAGYGWDQLKNSGGLGNLFGGFDMQGNPGAASEAYLENLRNMGFGGNFSDSSGRGMVDPGGGMMGGPRSGAPLDPSAAGFGAGGPAFDRPDMTAPGIPGYGGPGGGYGGGGYGGLPPGMMPNPMNPNISMDWSYTIQPAGGGPAIPVISGPQWIGQQPTPSGYLPGQDPWFPRG